MGFDFFLQRLPCVDMSVLAFLFVVFMGVSMQRCMNVKVFVASLQGLLQTSVEKTKAQSEIAQELARADSLALK